MAECEECGCILNDEGVCEECLATEKLPFGRKPEAKCKECRQELSKHVTCSKCFGAACPNINKKQKSYFCFKCDKEVRVELKLDSQVHVMV